MTGPGRAGKLPDVLMIKSPLRSLVILWVAWAILLLGYQAVIQDRLVLRKPDFALSWTPSETGTHSQDDKPYLMDQFMNAQVSWDSEYYLSIANGGYEDALMRRIPIRSDGLVSQNYAFFPFYPLVMRAFASVLGFLPLTGIGKLSLAGTIISLLGTLGGMIALWDLLRDELEDAGGLRAAFYLLIFPSGFFLAQVYSEGLFIGLAFGTLALLRRKKFLWAALLAVCATWTRAVGVALVLPIAYVALQNVDWKPPLRLQLHQPLVTRLLAILLPLAAFLVWRFSPLGQGFVLIEDNFFSRGLFAFGPSIRSWAEAWQAMTGANAQARIVFALEFLTVGFALISCFLTLPRYPALSWYGLLVIAVCVLSGVAQSQGRYMLVVPSMYIVLSRGGRNLVFDRVWTVASVLLMGMLATLYTFDMWAG